MHSGWHVPQPQSGGDIRMYCNMNLPSFGMLNEFYRRYLSTLRTNAHIFQ